VGFVGAIHQRKVDLHLLVEVAAREPGWSLVLIGPVDEAETQRKLAALPNIHLLGYKEYHTLPNYLRAFDVCVIHYRTDNKYIRNVFPMKFFEFLATGKPLVTTRLPSLESFGHVVGFASTPEEFVLAIRTALLARDDTKIAERLAVARKSCWESKVAGMEELVMAQLAHSLGTV
jgi:glycosyltransferase involved in cell wall biosynthesis